MTTQQMINYLMTTTTNDKLFDDDTTIDKLFDDDTTNDKLFDDDDDK